MENSYLFICPKCRKFHSGIKGEIKNCKFCNAVLDFVDIDYEKYSNLDINQQKTFRKNYIENYHPQKQNIDTSKSPTSPCISFMEIVSMLSLIASIIASVFYLIEEEAVVSLVVFLGGVTAYSIISVCLGVAKDIKAIRYAIEKHSK